MTENQARGLRRLLIAIFGTWAAFWTAYGYFGHRYQLYFWELFLKESQSDKPNWNLALEWSRLSKKGGEMTGDAVTIGGGGLLVGLYILVLGIWIYRGYRPKVAKPRNSE